MSRCYVFIVLFVYSLLDFVPGYSQDYSSWENFHEWFKENRDKGLKVGDHFPEISLGTVLNNKTGKTKFSDFNGKLIILDFWSSNCSDCIANFPKMEKLQQEFNNSIQIFIVNATETEEEIKQRMGKNYSKLPDLPSIVYAKQLMRLFPNTGVPHHVWIDGNGVVQLIGIGENTYEEKIRDFLAGKQIRFVRGGNVNPDYNSNIPYSKILRDQPGFFYTSFFSRFDNNYGHQGGGIFENVIDSPGRVRSTYLNKTILELYMRLQWKKFTGNTDYGGFDRFPFLLLLVKDSTLYSDEFIPALRRTDKDYFEHRFCYEQVSSSSASEQQRKEYMLLDLNNYFGNLYGTKAEWKKYLTPCYILQKTANSDKSVPINTTETSPFKKAIVVRNGARKVSYTGTIASIVSDLIREAGLTSVFSRDENHIPTLFKDETGFKDKIDLTVPGLTQIKTMEDLRKVLQPYGFDIIKEDREFEYLVIQDSL